jgi:hypothetical protein
MLLFGSGVAGVAFGGGEQGGGTYKLEGPCRPPPPQNFKASYLFIYFNRLGTYDSGKNKVQAPQKKFNLLSTTIIFFLFLKKKILKTQQSSEC